MFQLPQGPSSAYWALWLMSWLMRSLSLRREPVLLASMIFANLSASSLVRSTFLGEMAWVNFFQTFFTWSPGDCKKDLPASDSTLDDDTDELLLKVPRSLASWWSLRGLSPWPSGLLPDCWLSPVRLASTVELRWLRVGERGEWEERGE